MGRFGAAFSPLPHPQLKQKASEATAEASIGQVFEEYLIWRWENMPTSLGVRPSGTGAVAQMRLVLMAQGDSVEILRQFKSHGFAKLAIDSGRTPPEQGKDSISRSKFVEEVRSGCPLY